MHVVTKREREKRHRATQTTHKTRSNHEWNGKINFINVGNALNVLFFWSRVRIPVFVAQEINDSKRERVNIR